MINEVLAVGRVISPFDSSTTKNGLLRAQARFEIAEERDDAAPWKTWCTVFAFGKTAEALMQAGVRRAEIYRLNHNGQLPERGVEAYLFRNPRYARRR